MANKYLLLLIAATILFSCKKETGTIDPPSPSSPASALLKHV